MEISRLVESVKHHVIPSLNLCSALDPDAQQLLECLNAQLCEFYNSSFSHRYFEAAEVKNAVWTSDMKAHWHLKQSISPGSRVVDLGCGSIHACRNLSDRQIQYTGVDWSIEQLAINQEQMSDYTFVSSSLYRTPLPDESFDVAISLYAIEHLVWPHRLIDEMYRLVRFGGLIGLLFPPFRIRHSIKSFDYGLSARPFKEKLKLGRILDAALHLYQHRIAYLLYLRKHYPRNSLQHQFLINLKPICLDSEAWFPDADAVYLADTAEIVRRLLAKGAVLIEEWPKEGYMLVQKGE